ncbi:jg3013 [Pararge aegeria aegeria]|uniref:Jg3013 protein n=1 Tax=Pararge aegeria aegeria TaxID=348720 RepID=A0A8S4QR22_9NEOP|nr:jg3013 [Pararge aegeria aegeria]
MGCAQACAAWARPTSRPTPSIRAKYDATNSEVTTKRYLISTSARLGPGRACGIEALRNLKWPRASQAPFMMLE